MQPSHLVKTLHIFLIMQIKSPSPPHKTSFKTFSGLAPSTDELKLVTQLIKHTARLDAYGNETYSQTDQICQYVFAISDIKIGVSKNPSINSCKPLQEHCCFPLDGSTCTMTKKLLMIKGKKGWEGIHPKPYHLLCSKPLPKPPYFSHQLQKVLLGHHH